MMSTKALRRLSARVDAWRCWCVGSLGCVSVMHCSVWAVVKKSIDHPGTRNDTELDENHKPYTITPEFAAFHMLLSLVFHSIDLQQEVRYFFF